MMRPGFSTGRAHAVVAVGHKGVGALGLAPAADAVAVVSRGHRVVVDEQTALLTATIFIQILVGTHRFASYTYHIPIRHVMVKNITTLLAAAIII